MEEAVVRELKREGRGKGRVVDWFFSFVSWLVGWDN